MTSRESTEVWKPYNVTLQNPNVKLPHENLAPNSDLTNSAKSSMWNWISLLFFLLILGNACFTTLLLCHFSSLNQESLSLLRSVATKLDAQKQRQVEGGNNMKKGVSGFNGKFERLIAFPTPRSECMCPTCAPTIDIPSNKDPVSLVNQIYSIKASYACITPCIKPPLHVATLTIENHDKTWEGRGETKQRAKHEAAYKALLELEPEVAEGAHYFHEDYNPRCQDESQLIAHIRMERKKC